jgi:predicted  nucleic acid-binding Zn-ribbon protein
MKKITKEEYVKRLSEKFNNQIELAGEYTKFKEEVLHRCNKCGEEFIISPETMLRRSYPCQNCSAYDPNTSAKFRESRVGAPKKTIDQYRSQLSEKLNGQIEVLSDAYNGNRNPLLHRCTKCGKTFEANPFDMMRRKNACLFCGEDVYKREGRKLGSRKKAHEQVVQQLKDRWGDKVTAISEYDGNVKKMKFRCSVCENEFWARSISLLYHYAFWCPKCAEGRNGEKRKKTDEQYLEDLKKVWGDRFTPSPLTARIKTPQFFIVAINVATNGK